MNNTTSSTQSKAVSGFVWKLLERVCAQGVSFIVTIFLSRLLMPEDYGVVALVLIFITLADVFVSSGFSSALIQNKNADDTDFSTMLYCSLAVSIVLYIILFAVAPFIAKFYNNTSLILIIRIFALKLPISAVNSIQHAYVSRKMIFKKFFFSTIIGTVISGIVGVLLALKGFGVWALVAQYLINSMVDTFVLLFTIDWKPKWLFSFNRAKTLMNYGTKILLSDLSGTFFGQLRSLVIGKAFTSSDLAYYNKGQQLPNMITTNLSSSVIAILFPAISNENDNIEKVKNMSRKSLQILTFIMFPLLLGLASIAHELVIVLFTKKWIDSVFYIQLFCLSSAIGLISTTSIQTIKAIGRSDIVFRLEFVKKPIYLLLLIIGIFLGVKAIAITMVIYEIYGTFINMIQLKKTINYSLKEQFIDIFPIIIMSLIMFLICNFIYIKTIPVLFNLLIKIIIAIIIYGIECILIKPKALKSALTLIKNRKGAHV